MAIKRCQEVEAKTAATKKAKTTDPALESVLQEIDIAAQNQALAHGCRAVLLALARGGLSTPADERHTFQVTAVEKVGEALIAQCGKLEGAIAAAEEKLAERDHIKDAIETDRVNTKAALETKSGAARALKVSLAEATKQVIAAKTNLMEAEFAQELGDATRNETKVEKQHLEVTLAEDLTALRESACGEASVHLKAVLALGSRLNMDDHLMSALPNAVMMDPAARRRFDVMSLTLVETLINETVNDLEKQLEQSAPEAASRASAVSSMRGALVDVKATLLAAAADFRSANEQNQESLKGTKEVEKREREFKKTAQVLIQKLNDCQVDLELFQSGAWTNFEMLRDRHSKQAGAATPSNNADAEQSGMVEEAAMVAVGGQ